MSGEFAPQGIAIRNPHEHRCTAVKKENSQSMSFSESAQSAPGLAIVRASQPPDTMMQLDDANPFDPRTSSC